MELPGAALLNVTELLNYVLYSLFPLFGFFLFFFVFQDVSLCGFLEDNLLVLKVY